MALNFSPLGENPRAQFPPVISTHVCLFHSYFQWAFVVVIIVIVIPSIRNPRL